MSVALAFIKRGYLMMTSYPTAMLLRFVSLFLTVASFYFLAQLVGTQNENTLLLPYGGNYLAFLLIGVIFQNFVSMSLGAFSREISGEQNMGTLEFLLMSRVRLGFLLLSSGLWELIWNIATSTVMLAAAIAIFGVRLQSDIPTTVFIMFLTMTSLAGIGMASAGVILITKQGDPITWAVSMLSGFLSGVYYPVEVFPPFLRNLSFFLPTTHALIALRRAVISNVSWMQLSSELIMLVAFSCITVPAGLLIFTYGFNRARLEGSLSHY